MSNRSSTASNSRQGATGAPPTGSKVPNVKLVLLGDQGVGKSSLALRFVRGEFTENSEATIGGRIYFTYIASKLIHELIVSS